MTMELDSRRRSRRSAVVYRSLKPTPLLRHALLDAKTGLTIHVKHENCNPTGAFKVRGGLNLIANLSRGRTARRDHGDDRQPRTVDRARLPARGCALHDRRSARQQPRQERRHARARRRTSWSSGATSIRRASASRSCSAPTGCATCIRPTSRCSSPASRPTRSRSSRRCPTPTSCSCRSAAGAAPAAARSRARGSGCKAEIIGVQAAGADAFTRSWRSGTRVTGDRAATFAEGMATRVTFDLTFDILRRELNDIVTLSEEELAGGVRLALDATHHLAEGAGAAVARRRRQAPRPPARQARRLRDERRQYRPRHADADPGRRR